MKLIGPLCRLVILIFFVNVDSWSCWHTVQDTIHVGIVSLRVQHMNSV